MNAQEKQIKFDWLWNLVKPMLISILKEFGKEWLKAKIDKMLDGDDEDETESFDIKSAAVVTPKERCEINHQGQPGYCDDNGGWHPAE